MDIYQHMVKTIDGESVKLEQFKGKTLLIVNVASECGLTPHYQGLEELYQQYKSKGFVVLGFPCNQFGQQEPGSEAEIKTFCSTKFGVTFPMFAKVDVNGENALPLFTDLKLASLANQGDIEWNFAKFLLDKDGKLVKRYHPKTDPAELSQDIAAIL